MSHKPLPERRESINQKCKILRGENESDIKLFIIEGRYEDGFLGELKVELAREGELLSALMSCFCQSVSIGLQHGVPLDKFVDAFTFTRFEPAGPVQGHPRIRNCTSVVDLVFRHLAIEYLDMQDLAHVTPESEEPL